MMIESQAADSSIMVSNGNPTMLSNGGSNQVSNYGNGKANLSKADDKDIHWCNYYKKNQAMKRTETVKVNNKVIRSRLIFLLLNQVRKVPKTLESLTKKRLRN